jgi:hypothetical protein
MSFPSADFSTASTLSRHAEPGIFAAQFPLTPRFGGVGFLI